MPGTRSGMRYLEVMKKGRNGGKALGASQSTGTSKMGKNF